MTCPTCGKAMLTEWPHQHAHLELAVAPEPEVEPRRGRLGCSVLALFVIAVLLAGSAPRTAQDGRNAGTRVEVAAALESTAPAAWVAQTVEHRPHAPESAGSEVAGSNPAPWAGAPTPIGSVGTALLGGWISWADPDLGGDYLATRFPRGTLVRLCTPNRCIVRRSNDFGPSAAIDPPRIADLAVLDWEQLCGLPRARGVCRGTVEAIGELALPPTDAAP